MVTGTEARLELVNSKTEASKWELFFQADLGHTMVMGSQGHLNSFSKSHPQHSCGLWSVALKEA